MTRILPSNVYVSSGIDIVLSKHALLSLARDESARVIAESQGEAKSNGRRFPWMSELGSVRRIEGTSKANGKLDEGKDER